MTGRSQGFTLLEVLVVIGVIGMMAAVMLGFAHQSRSASQAQRGNNDVMLVVGAINDVAAGRSVFTSITHELLIDLELLPDRMVDSDKLRNVWGGEITVRPITLTGYAHSGFEIAVTNVPTDECVTMAQSLSEAFAEIRLGTVTLPKPQTLTSVMEGCVGANTTMAFRGQ